MIRIRLILGSNLATEDARIRTCIAESGNVLSIAEVGGAASIVISDSAEPLKQTQPSKSRILLFKGEKPTITDIENLQIFDIEDLLKTLARLAR